MVVTEGKRVGQGVDRTGGQIANIWRQKELGLSVVNTQCNIQMIQKCTLETYIFLLTNVTPINLKI